MSFEKTGLVGLVGATGAAAGYSAIRIAGLSAAGMMGKGAGIGCAAGPVGAVVGALVGVATFCAVDAILADDKK